MFLFATIEQYLTFHIRNSAYINLSLFSFLMNAALALTDHVLSTAYTWFTTTFTLTLKRFLVQGDSQSNRNLEYAAGAKSADAVNAQTTV